ncbi:MAG: hypothetical protein IKB34_01655 [Clostridia bacterium]|nr:hypothetical protein [Clostridia bacterium]
MVFYIRKYALLLLIGGSGYGMIELLWRGRTHWSMLLAGGLAFIFFSVIAEGLDGVPLLFKAYLGATGVIIIEFLFGVVFNIILGMNVWDYSDLPFNLLGQICPLFAAFWFVLSMIFIPIAQLVNSILRRLSRANLPAVRTKSGS